VCAVRELSGDVSMSKREVMDTSVIVTTPEKWDIVTRKTNSIYNSGKFFFCLSFIFFFYVLLLSLSSLSSSGLLFVCLFVEEGFLSFLKEQRKD